MASTLLIAIIALIALSIIAHFLKGAFKFGLRLAVIIAIIAGLLYLLPDLQNVQRKFPSEAKLFVLDRNGTLVGGFVSNGTDTVLVQSLAELQEQHAKGDRAGMRGSYYRLVIVKEAALADVEEAYILKNVSQTGNQLRALLVIENPRDALAGTLANRIGIPSAAAGIREKLGEYFPTDDALRSHVFAALTEQAQHSTAWLALAINKGDAQVYPESVAFKLLKQIPTRMLKWFSIKAIKAEVSERLEVP